ncbi:MAG: phytoene dehydrogenase [Anaerolineaceae bacterium]|nr:NAD(P)/FAD-dependent oxidoreductase [Anaerolineae bacterium]WKZ53859.1 MAG: NAD(P)/FAD-dependent oxidoreductase [Anaerolineales bacterium]GIK09162.1 MAG: phytoene dehydrogenase [Chloroflexota bacterium]GJQ38822.1 MAG: phytoene dehydrogenase [Anaerolineaceae bacterium]
MTDYDVIVIGSGAGGLTAAVALARAGKKVLVLEQHDRPGGWTHSFTLNGYRFSPGVHYIGDLQEGGGLRRIYDGLDVSQDLAFVELNPDGYDHIIVGDKQVDFPKGKENLLERLKTHFPHEARGIDGYFNDLTNMVEGLRRIGNLSSPLQAAKGAGNVIKWMRATGADLINAHVSDPVLRGVLAGQSGDHGMPPSQVSAFMHAGVMHHYLDGGYYPMGGAFTIPRAFVRGLKRSGGQIRLKSRVRRIMLEGRKAIGVELESGEEIRAGVVISNADPEATFGRMIGRDKLSARLLRKVDSVHYSTSCLSLFFATDMDLRRDAGLDSGNMWYYDHANVDKIYADGLTDALLREETPPGMFLTVTTLKDPSKMRAHGATAGHHTCESFAFVGYDAFEKWAHTKYGARPADYEAMKEDLAWRMVRGLEKRIPGLSKHITYYSLGTPLSNEHYLNATRGNLYGIDKRPSQVGPLGFSARTEFEGLFLCGQSTTSHGVAGVTASGVEAAKAALNVRARDILTGSGGSGPLFLQAEDTSAWAGHLKEKVARSAESKEEEEKMEGEV